MDGNLGQDPVGIGHAVVILTVTTGLLVHRVPAPVRLPGASSNRAAMADDVASVASSRSGAVWPWCRWPRLVVAASSSWNTAAAGNCCLAVAHDTLRVVGVAGESHPWYSRSNNDDARRRRCPRWRRCHCNFYIISRGFLSSPYSRHEDDMHHAAARAAEGSNSEV
ncbi:hypothetical protein PAHAL_1G237800 [Panicum hallii]|uniref:Uncharacterized protein n=1 Tax=Panicum hallii TaxID=206008 RepID=A0A2S3GNS1_9POAL|nr:hypothetical protein PAHAL_1G237800 [Panicum hallii]